MRYKMTRKEAHNWLYQMWENGELPKDFTEDHSEYGRALNQVMRYGYMDYSDFF